MDIEYKIHTSFRSDASIIYFGGLGYNKLKDKNQDAFICDSLTHEFIHSLLESMFNVITSCLFDFIGDSLVNTRILYRATCSTTGNELWSTVTKREGIKYIYNEYMIDNLDLIQSYLICNYRSKE